MDVGSTDPLEHAYPHVLYTIQISVIVFETAGA